MAPPLQLSSWGIFINVTMLPSVLKAGNNLLVISVAWAVLVEFQFYFAAAALTAIARRFRAMRQSAWLLNFARGALIVDADLIEAVPRCSHPVPTRSSLTPSSEPP